MGKLAFVFPGQGSQYVGMGQDIVEAYPDAKDIFQAADERLGFSLSDIIFNGPDDTLTLTENTQPALLTVSTALMRIMQREGLTPDYAAGHSLGEYSALVAAGALSFEDAVFAVRQRGQFMAQAVPAGEGSMAAVMGLKADSLTELCEQVTSSGESVQLANINSTSQIVISGTAKGVEQAGELAKEKGAKRVIPLNVSGPFHSSLMKPAADQLSTVLNDIDIQEAECPVIANVTADVVTSSDNIYQRLIEQLYSPVRWVESVETMKASGVDTYIEIGPGKVLSGLIKKVDRRAAIYQVNDVASLQETLNAIKEGEA
ncbi:ACP S-malonyltransferase [Tuberibacillus sp. Marseille-P3662]|uniref:ACP S-malonyltransferase n=1 Tax=Tuberibacillus sp. Marseille-P3662 TaxID=1965358 RepID=UPI000A1C991F|nr:ACP S-malonyltransferase [Tuberibacillus sp. Marseille-P3662]